MPNIGKNNNRVRSLDTTSIPNALRTPGTEGYSECAATLILQYETIVFEELHRAELHLLPTTPGFVLDIGAGIGIDAAWFAARGHRVVAVEPTEEFRIAGMARSAGSAIEWLDDALPSLDRVLARRQMFDTVILNAVWMHLNERERRIAMAKVAALLAPNGLLMLSLRHGSVPKGRRMFQVSGQETVNLAGQHGLRPILNVQAESYQLLNRTSGVVWTRLAFRHAE